MAPRSSNRSVYLPDDLWAWLDAAVEGSGLSVNGQVRVAVQEHRRNADHLKQVTAAPPKSSTPPAFGPIRPAPGARLKKVKGA